MNWIIKTENLHCKFPMRRRCQGGTLYYNNINNDSTLDSPSALHIKQYKCNSPNLHLRTLKREVAQPRSVWRHRENIGMNVRKPPSCVLGEEDWGGEVWTEGWRTIDRISALKDKYIGLLEYMHIHARQVSVGVESRGSLCLALQSNAVLCSRQTEYGGDLMLILRLSGSWNYSVCERIVSIIFTCSKYAFLKTDITFSFACKNVHDRWTAILTALLIIVAHRFLKNSACVYATVHQPLCHFLNIKWKKEERRRSAAQGL